jgi:predicted nucleotidyltransferase
MQVSSDDTLAGVPLIDIRNFIRRYPKGHSISISNIESGLAVPHPQAELIAKAMAEAGLIEPTSEAGNDDPTRRYSVTTTGGRLCATRFVKRITRAKADALVKQMLERIASINARDELVYRVSRVRAFGSYASDAPEVGDIDLAVELEQRYPDKDIIEQLLARAEASGKRLSSYMDQLSYGQQEVHQLLKGRSPYLAIEGSDCPEKFGVATVQLFPDLVS